METYTVENPTASILGLLNQLKLKRLIEMKVNVVVTVLGNDQVEVLEKSPKLASVFVDGKKVRKGFKIEFVCPKCGKHQKKAKDGDLCWRCQKGADAFNLLHAPVDGSLFLSVGASQVREDNPLFAAGAGVRVAGDGHIGSKKLG